MRAMGRTDAVVQSITIADGNCVVPAALLSPTSQMLNVTEKGYGKRTEVEKFNLQHRGGKGLKIHQLTEKTGKLTGVLVMEENEELMIMTSEGVIIRLRGNDISTYNRTSQGVRLVALGEGASVAGIAKISEADIESAEEAAELIQAKETAAGDNQEMQKH